MATLPPIPGLALDPLWLIIFTSFIGLVVGSFLNVLILRLPLRLEAIWRAEMINTDKSPDHQPTSPPPGIVTPRSFCPQCKTTLSWWENIPLLSWLLLRGHCHHCHKPISARYPTVELLTAITSALVTWQMGPSYALVLPLMLTWILIALAFIDLDHQLLPDLITLPGIWLGLIASTFTLFTSPGEAIIGASAGYLSLWLIFHLFYLLTGKKGMGYGDFKLMALAGAWLGWQALPLVILLAATSGSLVGVTLILSGRQRRSQPIPFGPFLAAAIWITMVWGEPLTSLYLIWVSGV